MKAGKVTAKLRDAVKIHLMEDGKAVKVYRNIELPDALKELEIKDFKFLIECDKIEFQLFFDKGILPAAFPESRPKVTRAEKAAKAAPQVSKPEVKITSPALATPISKAETKATAPAPAAKPEPKTATSTPAAKLEPKTATPVPTRTAKPQAKVATAATA